VRPGRVLALDVGKARIGLALCDPDRILASPLAAVTRSDSSALEISRLIEEHSVAEIVVGLPVNLRGETTASTEDAYDFAAELKGLQTIPVHFIDERFTTATAAQKLRAAGKDSRSAKTIIDSVAACEILETYLYDWRKKRGSEIE
jgi:putative Holliday junction resolvase